jgi:hypothetical protein
VHYQPLQLFAQPHQLHISGNISLPVASEAPSSKVAISRMLLNFMLLLFS